MRSPLRYQATDHVFLHGGGHYVLLTGCSGSIYHVFDPYFSENEINENDITVVKDRPYSHNLDISEELLNSESGEDFSMGRIKTREALIIRRHMLEDLYII